MTTTQKPFLYNRVAIGLGNFGALLLVLTSSARIHRSEATSLDWAGFMAGILLACYWLAVDLKGRQLQRRARAMSGRSGSHPRTRTTGTPWFRAP
jgi:uncharacterized membrane protein